MECAAYCPHPPPDKLFLKGGRKSGLWHMLGSTEGAETVLLAEGYATAASLRQATGLPVAVGFDAGNLLHVAKALHAQLPTALLVVCGDDDAATAQRVGRNTGRAKAEAAANAVGGVTVFPAELPEGGSDFNDMHKAHGLQAVKDCVLAAIEAHQQALVKRAEAAEKLATEDPDNAPPSSDEPFSQTAYGVWFHGRDKDGNPTRPLWLCSPLQVEALTRNQEGLGWGYLQTRWASPSSGPCLPACSVVMAVSTAPCC